MKLLVRLSAILMLAAPVACATPARQTIVTDTSCTSFAPISYAQLPAGVTDDPGNKVDSDATVREVEGHNAKWDVLCAR